MHVFEPCPRATCPGCHFIGDPYNGVHRLCGEPRVMQVNFQERPKASEAAPEGGETGEEGK